jgi:hypothetical protein
MGLSASSGTQTSTERPVPAAAARRRRGASMVEAALVLMTVLAIIIGILDFGQVIFFHQGLVDRARAAARYGSVNYENIDGIRNIVLYNSPNGPADDQVRPFLGLSAENVVVTRESLNSNEERIVVQIQNYPFRFFSPWIAGLYRGKPILASAPAEN